jgi:UDP-N-acetyl-D-glucosamine dehydrogenase
MLEESGLKAGQDFCLAFSPERIDPGNEKYDISNITKLVGAATPLGTEITALLYRQIVDNVVPVSSPRVAEAAKLLENTFRSVNIALANEMAIICRHLEVDVWEVIDAAATKPFGFMAHYPGPGIGGHCIPLDPHYLSWKARLSGYEPRFIALASRINGDMPQYVIDLVTLGLNDLNKSVRGSRILLLGVSYKRDVGDLRESPALNVIELLRNRGAYVSYTDPYIESLSIDETILVNEPLTPELVRHADIVVVATNHSAFDYSMVAREAAMVIDTRNAMRPYALAANVRFI